VGPIAAQTFWRRQNFLSLLQFEPSIIQMVTQALYMPQHTGYQNITLQQIVTAVCKERWGVWRGGEGGCGYEV